MEIFEMEKEFDELMKKGQELIEKLKENQSKKAKRWKPKDGDKYYYISTTSQIDDLIWTGTTEKSVDYVHYKLGNCFRTEEEAQKELVRRIAEQELLSLCDWESGDCWEIFYDTKRNVFDVTLFSEFICNAYRFASKESAKKAFNTLGEDKLKLVFRID